MKETATSIASATITIFLTGCIIIAHDVSTGFRQSLAALTGHHWISVSMIAIILFVLSSGLLLGSKSVRKLLRVYNIRLWSTALITLTLIMMLGILAVLIDQFLVD
jgi:ABC-type proline/glycine betaine transport system permease subunit